MWGFRDLGLAGGILAVSAIGITPIIIILGVMLGVGVGVAVLTGWINTVIYTLAGIGVVALWLKVSGFFGFGAWRYLGLLIVPIFALLGWGINHTSYLSIMPNMESWVAGSPEIVLPMNDVNGEPFSFYMTFQLFGALMSIVGGVVGVTSLFLVRRKRR